MRPYGRVKTRAYFVNCGCKDCAFDRKAVQRNTGRARRFNKKAVEEGLKDYIQGRSPSGNGRRL